MPNPKRRHSKARTRSRRAHDFLEVDVGAGRDLAGDDREAGGDERLAGDAAGRILGQDGVENGV